MILYLHPDIRPYFSGRQTQFEQCMALTGESFRELEGRQTLRVKIGEKYYFIKKHHGVGWKEILKNWLQLRAPVVSARHEWEALRRLEAYGVHVPKCMGYGEEGKQMANRRSFVIMEELEASESLETIGARWRSEPPSLKEKWALIREVATIARTLHTHQMNHRDFYLCHFLRKTDSDALYLIDLHRAKQWKSLPKRWIIKDLGGLYFSAKEVPLTQRDEYRFIKAYRQQTLKMTMSTEKSFWRQVKQRGEALYRDCQGR